MAERDRKKSPEEMAYIMDELKLQKEKKKREQDIKNVRNGQIIIFIITGFMVISSLIEYYELNEAVEVFYIYAPIVVTFLLLGIFYFKSPYIIPIVALILYACLIVIAASGDPSTIVKGAVIKGLIIAGLVRASKYGKDYQAAKKHISDTLDQGLFDEIK